MASTRRATQELAMIEIDPGLRRRVTQEFVMVEVDPGLRRRATQVLMMIEIQPATVAAANYKGPRVQSP